MLYLTKEGNSSQDMLPDFYVNYTETCKRLCRQLYDKCFQYQV